MMDNKKYVLHMFVSKGFQKFHGTEKLIETTFETAEIAAKQELAKGIIKSVLLISYPENKSFKEVRKQLMALIIDETGLKWEKQYYSGKLMTAREIRREKGDIALDIMTGNYAVMAKDGFLSDLPKNSVVFDEKMNKIYPLDNQR